MKNTFSVLRSKGVKVASAVAFSVAAVTANAAVPTTDVVAEISGNSAAIITIGGAILVILALVAGISHTRKVVR